MKSAPTKGFCKSFVLQMMMKCRLGEPTYRSIESAPFRATHRKRGWGGKTPRSGKYSVIFHYERLP